MGKTVRRGGQQNRRSITRWAAQLLPSADQLRQTYRGLDTEFICDRIASEELSEMALQIAREELLERQVDEQAIPRSVPVTHNAEAYMLAVLRDFISEPFGWTWGMWFAVLVPSILAVASFGTTARQQTDQAFLFGVIFVQALLLCGIVRAFVAVFRFGTIAGTLAKLLAIGAMAFVLLGLTVCSELAKHGWGGG
jgi:hypothetical protein